MNGQAFNWDLQDRIGKPLRHNRQQKSETTNKCPKN